ncbi:hypothetical protein CR513_40715, partial [Mucuna pruriens]
MDNDSVSKVIGVGDVCLKTNMGVHLWIKGVKHAPDVCFNLHMLDDGGYENHFGYEKWKLTKGNLVVAREEKISKLYWTKTLVAKDSNVELEKCFHYIAAFSLKEVELLELVHSNVCDPLKALVEKQSCKKVKCIRSDNGDEHYGPFNVYCKQQGIRHERTLIEKGEALYIAVHVINLSLAVALNTKYDHLRVFGCKAFVHVPKDQRSKLDMKTRQGIFIGRLYDLVENKLVRICNVQFIKDQTIEDIDKVKNTILDKDNSLSKIDPVQMLVHDLDIVDNNFQNGEQHDYVGDQQLGDVFYVPLDDDAEEEQEMSQDENLGDAPEPPLVQLRKSNR